MKKSLPSFTMLALCITETIAICNFYVFFSSTENYNYSYIELWPWLVLVIGTFFLFNVFLRNERELAHVVLLCVLCCVISIAIMSLYFIHIDGIIAWAIAWAFIGGTIVRSCLINFNTSDINSVITHCEVPSIGIAFLLAISATDFYYMPPYYIVLAVAALVFNVLALTVARIHEIGGSGEARHGSAIIAATVCISVIAMVSSVIARLTSGIASSAVTTTTLGISWIFSTIGKLLTAFWLWFASLFPEAEVIPMETETADAVVSAESGAMDVISSGALGTLAIIMAASVLCLLLWLFFKFRKKGLRRQKIKLTYKRPKQVVEKISLWRRFLAFVRARYRKLVFEITVRSKKNTPEGAVIMLAKIGKKHGAAKENGESYHAYLKRLIPLCRDEDAKAVVALESLSEIIDSRLYAPMKTTQKLSAKEYRRMRSAVSNVKKV